MEAIIKRYAVKYGISIAAIKGCGRGAKIVEVRRKIIKEAHKRGHSSVTIGKSLNRDHTTILHHLAAMGFR